MNRNKEKKVLMLNACLCKHKLKGTHTHTHTVTHMGLFKYRKIHATVTLQQTSQTSKTDTVNAQKQRETWTYAQCMFM